jgi:hypothetical protein
MTPSQLFITAGLLLLAPAALTGFMQARQTAGSTEHTLWRVAHSGGTAGAVQLLALGAVLDRLRPALGEHWLLLIAVGVSAATWTFFIGPLLRATGRLKPSRIVNGCGAIVAAPAYCALPLLLL